MFASKNIFLKSSGGYTISRSVRLRSSASAYFNRTPASATNRTTWTFSSWIKRGALTVGSGCNIFLAQSSNTYTYISFNSADQINVGSATSGTTNHDQLTVAVFRDPSAWYHIVLAFDTTQATAANRVKLWVNGNLQTVTINTQIAQNTNGSVNNTVFHSIGSNQAPASFLDGYLTEVNFIDGQALTPSSFGETNAVTGVWQPKAYTGTYGTNGFELNFSDNSAATATTIGKDNSGNGNNWTPNNISVTAGVTYDSMLDVPTLYADGGNGRGNYAVLNPLNKDSSQTVSDGNLTYTGSASLYGKVNGSIGMSSGKWYWEATLTGGGGSLATTIGIATAQSPLNASPGDSGDAYGWGYYNFTGNKYNNGTSTAYGSTYTTNDVIGVAFDADAGTLTFYKNNTSQGTAFSSLTSGPYFPSVGDFGTTSYPIWAFNFGQRPFTYTPPTGFVALNTQNLPTPTISNGANYMAATTYTGTGATQSISNAVNGISFQPDFVWFKSRATTFAHALFDSVRGVTQGLASNDTATEFTSTAGNDLAAFTSTGFTVGAPQNWNSPNNATSNPVAWQWNAGGSTVTNTSGSISAQVRANATAGFSVCTFNVGASGAKTFGHGLGVAPKMVIVKSRTSALGWCTYHASATTTTSQYLQINLTSAVLSVAGIWGSTLPTSTLVGIGSGTNVNVNDDCVAYCFAAVAGYSAFGSYTGNGSTDGPFVFLGFRPRFVMWKRTDTTGDWVIQDTTRGPYNQTPNYLIANSSGAEGAPPLLDINSNGFKIRINDVGTNASGGTYVYMAFCENPFKLSLAR
jgi:hypothetical protein